MASTVYFCALFNRQSELLAAGIDNSGRIVQSLYLPGRSIYNIERSVSKLRCWLEKLLVSDKILVTNNFKSILHGFDLPLPKNKLRVFDLFLPLPTTVPRTFEDAAKIVNGTIELMHKRKLQYWQYIAANAAVVYESLERRGILAGLMPQCPKWSQRTFSGRSKTTGFNLQGTSDEDYISDPRGSQSDWLINFDWRAADIRMAAILSGDELLARISTETDPYTKLAMAVGGSRDECKFRLLRAINAIQTDDSILEAFPTMRRWMSECKEDLEDGRAVTSILGRRFFDAARPRSAFNATMQGSIAHAMQLTIRRIWELDFRLLVETHDSVTVACNKDLLKYVIRTIANLMCRPFKSILKNDPVFPVRVNIGKEWCKWKPYRLYTDVDQYRDIR